MRVGRARIDRNQDYSTGLAAYAFSNKSASVAQRRLPNGKGSDERAALLERECQHDA